MTARIAEQKADRARRTVTWSAAGGVLAVVVAVIVIIVVTSGGEGCG